MKPRVAFLLLGETLLVPHLFPIIEAIAAKAPNLPVDVWISNAGLDVLLRPWIARLPSVRIRHAPGFRQDERPAGKLPTLARLLPRLALVPVVVCAEQTSLWIPRLLPWFPSRFVKTSHGVGSMSARDDGRRRSAHRTLVPSEQERKTYLDRGMPPERIVATGYVKAGFRHRTPARSLFAEGRPILLYTPHWQPHRSSWPAWGRDVVARLAAQDEWNVILAPHQRLIEKSPEVRDVLAEVAHLPHVHCDLDSFAMVDGSYTAAADLYLGDTSSQLIEFLIRPRPAIFLDPRSIEWHSDPSYAMWWAGEVVTKVDQLMPTIRRARESHADFAQAQRDIAVAALGDMSGVAPSCAADEVLRVLATTATGR